LILSPLKCESTNNVADARRPSHSSILYNTHDNNRIIRKNNVMDIVNSYHQHSKPKKKKTKKKKNDVKNQHKKKNTKKSTRQNDCLCLSHTPAPHTPSHYTHYLEVVIPLLFFFFFSFSPITHCIVSLYLTFVFVSFLFAFCFHLASRALCVLCVCVCFFVFRIDFSVLSLYLFPHFPSPKIYPHQ
jgi:hypothetical protein